MAHVVRCSTRFVGGVERVCVMDAGKTPDKRAKAIRVRRPWGEDEKVSQDDLADAALEGRVPQRWRRDRVERRGGHGEESGGLWEGSWGRRGVWGRAGEYGPDSAGPSDDADFEGHYPRRPADSVKVTDERL